MKYVLLFLGTIFCATVLGQSRVIYPKPVVIDLSKPQNSVPKGLDKKATKKWRELKQQHRLDRKAKEKLYAFKLDSLESSPLKDYAVQNIGSSVYQPMSFLDAKNTLKDSLTTSTAFYKKQKIECLKKKYGLPFVIDSSAYSTKSKISSRTALFDVGLNMSLSNDSLFVFSNEVDSLSNIQLANYSTHVLTQLPMDSSLLGRNYMDYQTDLQQLEDSLSSIDYGQMAASLAINKMEEQIMSQSFFQELPVPLNNQSTENIKSSYEEMIGSQQYTDLMKTMPGKKAELERIAKTKNFKLDSFPIKPNFFKGHEKELLNAQKELVILKKKKSLKNLLASFLNQDMESIEQKKLAQRFNLSGHLQVSGKNPLLIDYSPSISYQITGKSSIGIGASGRIKIGDEPSDEKDLFAYRSFFQYTLIGSIFLHTEWENAGVIELDTMTDLEKRVWSNRWLIGLGKDLSFNKKVAGSILILYNFNSASDTPHGRRIQVRYGFKF